MAPFGYHPVQHTPVLWVHDNRNTIFSLVVENICVQYSSMENSGHFLNALREKYLVTFNMEATVCIGINLDWGYVHRTVTLPMPNYVHKALHRFQHIIRGVKEYSPHICAPIQYADPLDSEEHLSNK